MGITVKELRKYAHNPPDARVEVFDDRFGRGYGQLSARISSSGRIAWYWTAKRRRTLLGYWRPQAEAGQGAPIDLSVREALVKAQELEAAVMRGEAPTVQPTPSSVQTVGRFWEEVFYPAKDRELAANTMKTYAAAWAHVEPLLDTPLDHLNRTDVLAVTDELVDESPAMANKVLSVLKNVCAMALDRGVIQHSQLAGMKLPAKPTRRDRVLSEEELAAIWPTMRAQSNRFVRLVLPLILATCLRPGEVASMRPEDVDMAEGTWDAKLHKTGERMVVPLSPLARDLVREALEKPTGAGVFVRTPRTTSPKIRTAYLNTVRDAHPNIPRWTAHDLRRTSRTLLSKLGVRADVAERCLGHSVGTAVTQTYDRWSYLDERREALNKLGAHLNTITGANVVSFKQRSG